MCAGSWLAPPAKAALVYSALRQRCHADYSFAG
jgi:hypothetical protein